MACIIKVGNEFENLSGYNTFIKDTDPNSQYFRVTKFQETFTSGKNLFLMEGSPYLKESTAIKIEIVDVDGNTLYVEPGRGEPDYYEGNSVVLSAHVYDNIPVGPAKITVLGELKEYIDSEGILRPIPEEWKGAYNVKWERNFYINKNLENSTPVIFYKRPVVTIEETEGGLVQQEIPTVIQSGSVEGRAEIPELGTDIRTWRAGTLYRLNITSGPGWTGSVDENQISIPSLNYTATVKEVLNKTTVLVDKPYLVNNKVSNFPSAGYSTTFEYFDGRTSTDTIVTGSYQRLVFKNIDTFTGNLDKVKIFRKSRSDISDFKFLEEVKVKDITSDLLVDPTSPASEKSGGAGRFTEANFNSSWETSSIQVSGSDTSISFDNDLLYESIRINVPSSSYQTESVNIVTTTEFDIFSDVDYEVSLKTLVSGSYTDSIPGDVNVVSESVSTTTYYLYDPTKLPIYPISYLSSSGYDSILIQSASQDLTRNYVYDNSKLSFFDTPQNLTGSAFTSIEAGYSYNTSLTENLTFDTTSGDWGSTSIVETSPSDNANIVSTTSLFGLVELNVMVWLDSGSYTIPMSGNPQDVSIYSEVYQSGSNELAILSFENIGGDARFYYYNSTTNIDNLQSFRNSIEYSLEPIDVSDYNTPQGWHTSGTGSQVIIPFEQSGYNYVHIDYRTNRDVEPLNAELITVKRLDRLNDDILYGESYDILSMNFNTGEIEFTDGTEADFSGTLNIENGQLILTIDGDTQYAYIVEADFNNSVMVFISRLTIGDMTPISTRYSLYDLFELSGSDVLTTTTSSFVVPRVPTRGGDYLYTEAGYPLSEVSTDSRDFLTPVFDSPSSSLDFQSPLEIPYIFRNDSGLVTDVYTFDSSSGQIYNVSSVSSSGDINSDSYVYDNTLVQQGFVPSGSIEGSIYVDATQDANTYQGISNSLVNLTFKQQSFLSGSLVVTLLTDSGVTQTPSGTGSIEYYIESFVSESGYQSGNTVWRNSFSFRNFDTSGMLFYNHSSVSQSAMESYSGSVNYLLSSIDTNDFQNIPLKMLETGSQAIFDFETSGSGYNFIYLDYRSDRTGSVLNANLLDLGLVDTIDGSPITNAIDTFALSGSNVTTITSSSVYVPQVPITSNNYLFDDVVSYPFFTSSVSSGTFIGDRTNPSSRETILNSPINIPYVLTQTSGKVNEVLVKRIDKIYTASSEYNTTGTSIATPPVFVSKSLVEPITYVPKTLKLYVTGSSGSVDFKEYLTEITADSTFSSRKDISNIITSTYESSNTKLGIEVRGDGWQLSKLALKPATAKGFSPKIFKTVQEEDRNLQDETFDYNFEMYDVNNNYIPVKLQKTVRFTQGNKQTLGTLKLLTFESDKTAFRFYTGSIANPPFQQIRLIAQKQNVSGSITYASAAFDSTGQYIEPSSYSGTYPGGLTSVGENGGIITIANFSGSDTNYEVGSIIYTASVDGLSEFETIFRLEDGLPTSDLIVNNNRSVFTYKLSDGSLNPPNQSSTITVKRKNLASNTETITANSSSVVGTPPPLILVSDNSTTGVATYFLSGSSLDLATGSVQYEFSASDEFGLQVDNVTTITPISFLEGVVLYLSNERGVLPAYYSGVIPSSSYVYTSGSTKLYVGGDEVTYNNSGGNNTYKIIGVTGSGITPNEVAPTTNNYGGVPGTMTTESSSMEINVRYTDSGGETYDFGREANFNIVREGEQGQPGLDGANGPGLVFTGEWDDERDYLVTSGALARRDAVIYANEFYLAISSSGPSYGGAVETSDSNYWEALGTASRFVAAELAIFAESYVQNTINVGTNNSGSASAANITIAGGTNYPYISIDQGATTGTQGYNVGNGIFLGINGNNGTGSLSLESPILGGGELLWNGETLSIRGAIEFTNTPGLITETLITSSLYAENAADSASNAQTYAENTFESASAYSASLYAYASQSSYEIDQDLQGVIAGTTALENGSGTTFINAGIIYSPNIGGTNGYISNAFRVGENGITLDGANSRIYVGDGLYDDSNTPFYFASGSTNIFSLGDKLTWDGSNLSIEGSITLTNTLSDYTQNSQTSSMLSDYVTDSDLTTTLDTTLADYTQNSQTSSLINPSTYSFGPSALYPLSVVSPSTSGLYLGNQYLGYYNSDSSDWKTFMADNGGFFLGGQEGALQWDGVNSLVVSGSIHALNGYFSGEIVAEQGEIAEFEIQGSELRGGGGSFILNSADAGSLVFYDSTNPVVKITNSGTLTPIVTATAPSFTGTINSTNSDYEQSSGITGYLATYDATSTYTNDSSLPTMTPSAGLDGYTATITATLTPGDTNGYHINSLLSLGTGASVYGHTVQATIVAELLKGGTVIATQLASVGASATPSTTNVQATGNYDVTFSGIVLEGGATYTIRTAIRQKSSYVYGSAGTTASTLSTYYYAPDCSSITVSVQDPGSNAFAELTRGGFQVVSSTTKAVIIPTAGTGDALIVTGSISATGNITGLTSSDLRLKENIKLISDALDKVKEINGVTFDWKEGFEEVHNFKGNDVGVIAQDVEYVLPQIVQINNHHGYRGLKYERLTPLLIEAIKELSEKVDTLQNKLNQLENGSPN